MEAAGEVVISEGHIAVLKGYVEGVKELGEVGVVSVIHDDESGVDPESGVGPLREGDGVGVSADAVGGFEEGDVVMGLKQMCAR